MQSYFYWNQKIIIKTLQVEIISIHTIAIS